MFARDRWVQRMGGNPFENRTRHPVLLVESSGQAGTHLGGRHLPGRHGEFKHQAGSLFAQGGVEFPATRRDLVFEHRFQSFEAVARSGQRDDVPQGEQFVPATPARQAAKRVGSDHAGDGDVRAEFGAQFAQGVEGVAGAGSA